MVDKAEAAVAERAALSGNVLGVGVGGGEEAGWFGWGQAGGAGGAVRRRMRELGGRSKHHEKVVARLVAGDEHTGVWVVYWS
jgi:hypothetical protein